MAARSSGAVTVSNGSRWEFDVPRGGKSSAEKLVSLLAG
jgi:hypothetical protein